MFARRARLASSGGRCRRVGASSEIIASIGYERRSELLEVEFRNGWIYEYDAVPVDVYNGLMDADSHGHFLKPFIVDQFTTRRTR